MKPAPSDSPGLVLGSEKQVKREITGILVWWVKHPGPASNPSSSPLPPMAGEDRPLPLNVRLLEGGGNALSTGDP